MFFKCFANVSELKQRKTSNQQAQTPTGGASHRGRSQTPVNNIDDDDDDDGDDDNDDDCDDDGGGGDDNEMVVVVVLKNAPPIKRSIFSSPLVKRTSSKHSAFLKGVRR